MLSRPVWGNPWIIVFASSSDAPAVVNSLDHRMRAPPAASSPAPVVTARVLEPAYTAAEIAGLPAELLLVETDGGAAGVLRYRRR